MITIHDSQRISRNQILSEEPSVYFIGEALDDRGQLIHNQLSNVDIHQVFQMSFNVSDYKIKINNDFYSCREIANTLKSILEPFIEMPIIIDSTTLGFIEILFILRWFSTLPDKEMLVIYIEPAEYKSRTNYMSDYGKHEFDLSSHSSGFKAVPGFSKMVEPSNRVNLVSILGFERARLGQLLQLDEGAYIDKVFPVFATPSFKAGWDKHSFYQNVETLQGKSMRPEFVSADSPIDLINTLEKIKSSLDQDLLMLAPFGSKPLSVGAAVFLVNFKDEVILKYDHPVKKSGRSNGIGLIHSYKLKVSVTTSQQPHLPS